MQRVFQWINEVNSCQISPAIEEALFGFFSGSYEERMKKKFNHTTLSLRYYIYSCQEPITRSVQLPYIPVTAFSQTNLFLDLNFPRISDSRRLAEPR